MLRRRKSQGKSRSQTFDFLAMRPIDRPVDNLGSCHRNAGGWVLSLSMEQAFDAEVVIPVDAS